MADCVPDSSNAIEADEEVEDEQHSSGSVDEVGGFVLIMRMMMREIC